MKRDTRAHILDVGARIVHHKGFNATGIQEVLNSAGVPEGSFYFYFKSKEKELSISLDIQKLADFIVSSWQESFDCLKKFYGLESLNVGRLEGHGITVSQSSSFPPFQFLSISTRSS